MGFLREIFGYGEIWSDVSADFWREFGLQEAEQTILLLCGSMLLKVEFRVAKREAISPYARASCRVLEVDGIALDPKEQEGYTSVMELRRAPTKEEQARVLRDVLAKAGAAGNPVRVSSQYAESHLKLLKLRNRLATEPKGGR